MSYNQLLHPFHGFILRLFSSLSLSLSFMPTSPSTMATILLFLAALLLSQQSISLRTPGDASIRLRRPRPALKMMLHNFDGLLFDCDGVIAETERDAHRVTFNQAFAAKGIDASWDVELYGKLLKIGGGKERMTSYFNEVGWPSSIAEENRKEVIKELHLLKTELFQSVIESGAVTVRAGGNSHSFLKSLLRG